MVMTLLPKMAHPGYLSAKVRDKALASDVPYVRYLSCCGMHFGRDRTADTAVKARLEADTDLLVKYSIVNSLPTVTPFSRPIVTPLGRPEWAYPRSA